MQSGGTNWHNTDSSLQLLPEMCKLHFLSAVRRKHDHAPLIPLCYHLRKLWTINLHHQSSSLTVSFYYRAISGSEIEGNSSGQQGCILGTKRIFLWSFKWLVDLLYKKSTLWGFFASHSSADSPHSIHLFFFSEALKASVHFGSVLGLI